MKGFGEAGLLEKEGTISGQSYHCRLIALGCLNHWRLQVPVPYQLLIIVVQSPGISCCICGLSGTQETVCCLWVGKYYVDGDTDEIRAKSAL